MAVFIRFYSLYLFMCFVFLYHVNRAFAANQMIDSLEILESLSKLTLLKHHPQSFYSSSKNMSESFDSFLEDLRNQNLSENYSHMNCSSLSQYPILPKRLCTNGTLFKCMSSKDMLELVPPSTNTVSEALARLCPLILLQLHSTTCDSAADHKPPPTSRPSSASVWGYGIMFVTIISCCSLVGVMILPLLSKNVYQVVLMLFEGLAVGSLVGSSLFHLIPQSFRLLNQDMEHTYLWKALLIFGGIYLFYVSERFMKIFIDIRKEKKLNKSSCLPGDNSTEFLKPVHELKIDDCDKDKIATNGYPVLGPESVNNQNNYKLISDEATTKAVKTEIPLSHHGHQHEHVIEFEKGKSVIHTVAWMIIFGDGFHNFIDGLSIGAAFSESILAGISISVAVICEEFPHELGDFAVLLSAGMTMRQALMYNFLSALTCYLGLVIGILLGDLAEGAPYIFAFAGGMFLYIALVDMMGELSVALEEARLKGVKVQLKVFFIQNVGIILGIIILFIMARYADYFNFENLSGYMTNSGEGLDGRVKEIYTGLQEAKMLHGSLST